MRAILGVPTQWFGGLGLSSVFGVSCFQVVSFTQGFWGIVTQGLPHMIDSRGAVLTSSHVLNLPFG